MRGVGFWHSELNHILGPFSSCSEVLGWSLGCFVLSTQVPANVPGNIEEESSSACAPEPICAEDQDEVTDSSFALAQLCCWYLVNELVMDDLSLPFK